MEPVKYRDELYPNRKATILSLVTKSDLAARVGYLTLTNDEGDVVDFTFFSVPLSDPRAGLKISGAVYSVLSMTNVPPEKLPGTEILLLFAPGDTDCKQEAVGIARHDGKYVVLPKLANS